MNYFDVLELSIEAIEGLDEDAIKKKVEEAWKKLYTPTLGAGANIPRRDGRSNAEWQAILRQARSSPIFS